MVWALVRRNNKGSSNKYTPSLFYIMKSIIISKLEQEKRRKQAED